MLHRSGARSIALLAAGLSILAPALHPRAHDIRQQRPRQRSHHRSWRRHRHRRPPNPDNHRRGATQPPPVGGCLISGLKGMRIQESQDNKTVYTLEGGPRDLKVGDLVPLHGDRGPKGQEGRNPDVQVIDIKNNYGACPTPSPAPANSH